MDESQQSQRLMHLPALCLPKPYKWLIPTMKCLSGTNLSIWKLPDSNSTPSHSKIVNCTCPASKQSHSQTLRSSFLSSSRPAMSPQATKLFAARRLPEVSQRVQNTDDIIKIHLYIYVYVYIINLYIYIIINICIHSDNLWQNVEWTTTVVIDGMRWFALILAGSWEFST